jgi:hypothetical protein
MTGVGAGHSARADSAIAHGRTIAHHAIPIRSLDASGFMAGSTLPLRPVP